jgi:TolC family type I secretion outer membrane protein
MKSLSSLLFAAVALAAVAVFPAGAAVPVTPDIPEKLDLKNAIGYALENNYSIRLAREQIKEQEGLTVQVRAQALPNVSLNSSYTQHDEALNQPFTGTGGNTSPDYQTWGIALQVTQALYAGGSISSALASQRFSREAALLNLQATINAALLDVRTRFYDVLLAREQIKVQEQNVGLLTEQLRNVRNRFEAGAVSNFEVLQAEVQLANAQPTLITTRNAYRIAVDQLRQSLGYNNTTPGNLRKTPEFIGTLDYTPVSYDFQQALDTARASRPELQRLAKLRDASEAGVRVQQAGYKPTLSLVGGYEVNKANNSNRFSDSLNGWTVGVQSTWAIFDGRATAGKVAQARSQLAQANLTLGEQTLAVEVQVRTALSSLQEADELVQATLKTVGQAEESLRLANARFSAGTATQLDVLTSQVALTQARTNQLQANYNYNVALATLRQAIGQADVYTQVN